MEIPDTIQFCLCFNLAKVTLNSNCCKYSYSDGKIHENEGVIMTFTSFIL